MAAGDSGNYPGAFNGPLGVRGEHPALPFPGYAGKVWNRAEPLAVDCGFCLEGYHTDKTLIYWAGEDAVSEEADRAQDFCLQIPLSGLRTRGAATDAPAFLEAWGRLTRPAGDFVPGRDSDDGEITGWATDETLGDVLNLVALASVRAEGLALIRERGSAERFPKCHRFPHRLWA